LTLAGKLWRHGIPAKDPPMPIARPDQIDLEYFVHGHGPRRIVFAHGFQASAQIWRQVQDLLPAASFTSISMNNRGAGASQAPPREEDFTVQAFAGDLHDLVRHLGWDRFVLVGHSLGGATALQFAVDHPKLLEGLILLDPADGDGRQFPADGPGLDAIADMSVAAIMAQRASAPPPREPTSPPSNPAQAYLRQLAIDMANAPERRLKGSLKSMFSLALGDRVKAIPCPVLLAAGDADEVIPLKAMLGTWAKLPPGSGLHVWHGVDHSPNLSIPGEVTRLIRQFVDNLSPGSAG